MGGFKEIIKHSGNYLIANLATRALAFISIPVYTRLLSAEDYGIVNIFLGVAIIFGSIMSLSMDRSISRYFFDQKSAEDFRKFVGTSIVLAALFFLINTILVFIFAEWIGVMIGIKKELVYLLIPFTLISIIGLTFEQIYGPLKQSKKVALSSLVRTYLGFALSTIFIFIFASAKYYGFLIGQIIAGLIICIYWVHRIKPYFKLSFEKSYFKYILTYSVPLIPYALSGVIIEQFGKLAIGNSQGASDAGYYSLALAIGSLVSIIIGVTHQAWNPYYFEHMNSKNYFQLDKEYIRIFKITIVFAFGIAAFGNEIGLILAEKEFSGSLYLIPFFAIGYVFYQLAYTYLRNFGYSKSTYFMTLTIFVSGISNVIFNLLLIKKFGELGVAVSFILSYIIMALLAFLINKYFVKLHATPILKLLSSIFISVPFYCSLYVVWSLESQIMQLLTKLLIFICLAIIILWKDREEILSLMRILFLKIKIKK